MHGIQSRKLNYSKVLSEIFCVKLKKSFTSKQNVTVCAARLQWKPRYLGMHHEFKIALTWNTRACNYQHMFRSKSKIVFAQNINNELQLVRLQAMLMELSLNANLVIESSNSP